MNQQANLLEDFEKLTTEEWITSIEKYLKGKPYQSLFHQVEEGVDIEPFYRKAQTSPLNLPVLKQNDWNITEAFKVEGELAKLNKAILNALSGGANRLVLDFGDDVEPEVLAELLNGVYLEMIELQLEGEAISRQPLAWAKALAQLPKAAKSKGLLKLDKLASAEQAAQLLLNLKEIFPNWSCLCITVDSSNQISADLAKALKQAEATFWAALELGVDKKELIQAIYFDIEVNDDYFMSIARLRALHKLWATVLNAYDVEGNAQLLVRTTTSAASEDPYWNMIAASTQALSAAIGLADSIEVCPPATENTAFGRRIARNLQHLLKMESHINEIIDPAAGSYYIENYSMNICEKAWGKFIQ